MGLNKSKGNMYDWITHTWNPLGGECPHNCSYCSTHKLKARYPVLKNKYSGKCELVEHELKTNLGKGNFIFVVAQNDLFANEIDSETIERVIDHCHKFDNKYLFQTKNPERLEEYMDFLPKDSRVCTTIETNKVFIKVMNNCPKPKDRAYSMNEIGHKIKTYVTIEPIMDFDLEDLVHLIETCLPEQVNIGADSGGNKLPEPTKEDILELIEELEKFTKVKQKDNLKRLLK